MDWQILFFVLGSYLLGSIPFGLLISKFFGVQDPRTAGSGNIGFTNVLRLSGKKVGILTLLGDFGKGVIVAIFAQHFYSDERLILVMSLAVIFGHIFSFFLRFRGGKGVATALGAIVGLNILLGLILIGIWGLAVMLSKYSSGGALIAFGALPILGVMLSQSKDFLIFAVIVAICIYWRHQSNIINIIRGTESKVNNLSS